MPILDRTTALDAQYFHHSDDCHKVVSVGPRGGVTYPRTELYRRNGRTQTWKTRPAEFRIPIKYGLRPVNPLTESAVGAWHTGTAESCELGTLAASIESVQTGAVR